ncbi:MAG: NUDIX domain-containing protein [Marmoricola sp.]
MSDGRPVLDDPAQLADRPEQWPVTASRDLHRDDWVVGLREDTLHRPGHPEESFDRLVVEHSGAVIVLAVDDQERVCCLRQYRHAAGRRFVELPAGLCDAEGEDPAETARRELREEAELEAADWRHLLTVFPSVGILAETQHLYLARDLSPASRGDFAMRHEEADLEVFWAPVDALLDAVLGQRVQQSPLAVAVLAYDALRRRGRL